jgi:hypothetical protein
MSKYTDQEFDEMVEELNQCRKTMMKAACALELANLSVSQDDADHRKDDEERRKAWEAK